MKPESSHKKNEKILYEKKTKKQTSPFYQELKKTYQYQETKNQLQQEKQTKKDY